MENTAESSEAAQKPRPSMLSLTIRDKAVLYATYMPFVKGGAIFVPTSKPYNIGDEVFLMLNLMEETEKLSTSGRVVWITPEGSQGNKAVGIGIQFTGDEGTSIRNKIETYLAGLLQSDKPTHTL